MEGIPHSALLGQAAGFVALALCVVAFASRDDDRLLAILILGNVAFAVQFALFGAWAAAAISGLIIFRIVLARRFPGSLPATALLLVLTVGAVALTWQNAYDLLPLGAGIAGTISMFLLRGIPMRLGLVVAGFCWIGTNLLIGSLGALAAEALMLVTNFVTILRLARDRRRAAALPAGDG